MSGPNAIPEEPRVYRVTSKSVVPPEGSTAANAVGLLFERPVLGQIAPEITEALLGDLYAIAFLGRRCVCLYSDKKWLELRSILDRIPSETIEQRKI